MLPLTGRAIGSPLRFGEPPNKMGASSVLAHRPPDPGGDSNWGGRGSLRTSARGLTPHPGDKARMASFRPGLGAAIMPVPVAYSRRAFTANVTEVAVQVAAAQPP